MLKTGFRGKPLNAIIICVLLGLVYLGIGLFGSFAVTEVGQFLAWPRSLLVSFYEFRWPFVIIMTLALFAAIAMNYRHRFVPQFLSAIGVLGLGLMVYVINYMVPYLFFPSQHQNANYISVEQALQISKSGEEMELADEDRVYVFEVNGEAVAFPQEILWVPHIAGTKIGGEDVVMAYCVLSNLPLGFATEIDGKTSNLKVMMQAHNNLIMVDTNSGDLIQHINGKTEFGKKNLEEYPVQMMPWKSFVKLYPDGRVFFNNYDDDFMPRMWKNKAPPAMEAHFYGPDPLFPTLRMDDERLPFKEQVWGLNVNGEQVAIAKSYFDNNPVSTIDIGGESYIVKYFDELNTVGAFNRKLEGKLVNSDQVDPYGNSPEGKLERVKLFNGLFWMVWSHWFPETAVLI